VAAEVVEDDLNLSTPKDLLDLNLHVLAKSGQGTLIDASARIEAGARIDRTVVGREARVPAGAVLERCLVLPGVSVPAGQHQRRIFAADGPVDC
jgi:NDP-sugar pyrophosphorylase family protein